MEAATNFSWTGTRLHIHVVLLFTMLGRSAWARGWVRGAHRHARQVPRQPPPSQAWSEQRWTSRTMVALSTGVGALVGRVADADVLPRRPPGLPARRGACARRACPAAAQGRVSDRLYAHRRRSVAALHIDEDPDTHYATGVFFFFLASEVSPAKGIYSASIMTTSHNLSSR